MLDLHACVHQAHQALSMLDLVGMIEDEERKLGGRLTDYLPASSK